MRSNTTRDITYANCAPSRGGRALIRLMENSTGRLGLIRRASGYERNVADGQDFFDVLMECYGLSLEVVGGSLENIPRSGPLILIANHPYGILDGLIMGHILARMRGDFRILANSVFNKSQDLNRHVLPISFERSKEAVASNIHTRKVALDYLKDGGAIGVFPGGTVSTAARPFSNPSDPGWRSFTGRMIAKSGATVLPMYFDGHTSRAFQIASHMHANLRMGLLISEFGRRVDRPVRVTIGNPVSQVQLSRLGQDSKAMMDFLRKATYELSPNPKRHFDLGYEFEERHRT